MVAHATPISKECDYMCSTFKYIQVHHIVEMNPMLWKEMGRNNKQL
jgi:hypothetical protein